jgi:alkylation response protein AidB-like acyl-CoA dehydrogenase
MPAGKSLSPLSESIASLVADVSHAADDAAWVKTFRHGFGRLRAAVSLHPVEVSASALFEAAAVTARRVAVENLPLGIATVMHLYPLCALQCVPLPWWSLANLRRALLLRRVESGLVLANAGSERSAGAHEPVTLTRTPTGVRVDGTYDYVSLAHVADVVLFCAPLSGSGNAMFCAADLRSDSVRIGGSRFNGSMRLSDTCSVTFSDHRVPLERCIEIPGESALQCMSQYQRSWFELLLGEAYLARIEQLQQMYNLPRPVEHVASLNELAQLREYASRLLDDAAEPRAVESLSRVTATMKLRISWMAQAAAAAVRGHDEVAATELGYFRRQPTSDERILKSISIRTRGMFEIPDHGSRTGEMPARV